MSTPAKTAISPIDHDWIDALTADFPADRANRVARNSVTSANVDAAARNVSTMRTYHDTFSVSLPKTGDVTNQRQSGRCWMFSTYNVVRAETMRLLDVDNFEFSQVFGMFYDKLEKFNAGLGYILDTVELPLSSREVSLVMEDQMSDGGYWNFATSVIAKWGLVPKDAMPENACSKSSAEMNRQLERLFRKSALELRRMAEAGADADELLAAKDQMVAACHKILSTCLGEPPATFDLEVAVGKDCRAKYGTIVEQGGDREKDAAEGGVGTCPDAENGDKDEKPRRVLVDRGITPREFVERYVPFDPEGYVTLDCMPGDTRPFDTLYHLELTDNMVDGIPTNVLNVRQEQLEDAAVASLKAGYPCQMSCDVMQSFARHIDDFPGVLATDTMDYEALFGVDLAMERADMIDTRETWLTHAMTFQGVQLGEDGRPTAWRIENSWGKDACKDGYLVASAEWFALYGGEVVVRREFVPTELLAIWDAGDAVSVMPWDGMSAANPRRA